jgi:ketosteroid isomerase-like protein
MTTEASGAANVAMIQAGYKAFDEGAMDVVFDNWHPDVVYYGFDGGGQPREFHGVNELFAMLGDLATKMEIVTNEILEIQAVGPDMVVCRVRAHRKPRDGNAISHEFVQIFRIENGKITRAVEMISSAIEDYYRTL